MTILILVGSEMDLYSRLRASSQRAALRQAIVWFSATARRVRATVVIILLLCLISTVAHGQKPHLVVQTGHSRDVGSVAISRDGLLVLTGGFDHIATLWETASGRQIRRFEHERLSELDNNVTSVAFSTDRQFVLTGSTDKTARLWETATGNELRRFEHSNSVSSVAFSPNGRWVVTGSGDETGTRAGPPRLWETATGKEVRRLNGHSAGVNAVAFCADGRFVVTGSSDATARVWETATGREVRRFEHGQSDDLSPNEVSSVMFSTDGLFVLTGSDDSARLWEVATGKELRRFEGVDPVALSADGRFVLTGSSDGSSRLWETTTGKELRRFEHEQLNEFDSGVTSVAFSTDGQFVITGSSDKTARLWETATGKEVRRFEGHSDLVISTEFSPDGRFVLTDPLLGGSNRLWDTATSGGARNFDGGVCFASSPDGRFLLTGSNEIAYLWETTTGKEVRRFEGHSDSVGSVAFSSDGQRVLTGSFDKTARIWETATGKEVRRFEGHSGSVGSVAFSSDGQQVLTGSSDKTAQLWEAATGRIVRRFKHSSEVECVAFSGDGRSVLTGNADGTAQLWDAAAGRAVRRFKHTQIDQVAFSGDGRFVLTGGADNKVLLWETATGKEIRRFEGYCELRDCVGFSADGRFVVTGSVDSTAELWETTSGKKLCKLVSFADGRWAVMDPEGRFDTDNLEDIKGLQWVMPDDPLHALAPETFMRDYYEPRLLARILKGEKFSLVRPLSELNRVQPQVAITAVEPNPDDPSIVSLTVEVAGAQRTFSRAGKDVVMETGVSDVRLSRDGQLVGYQDGEVKLVDNKATLTFPGIRLARVEGKTDVEFSAYAFNVDRVKSVTARRSYAIPAVLKPVKGRAYVVSMGVNDSEDPAYRLNFAVNDAQEIQKTVSEALRRRDLFSEVVPVALVTRPTKQQFQTVLDLLAGRPVSDEAKRDVPNADKIVPARPEDTVLISFSCHGDSDSAGNFYLLPYDIGASDTHARIEDIYPKCISSEELSQWLRDVDAGEMVMIIDACHSAAAVESSDFKPGPMGSRGLGQLAYDKGMRILAASQADSVANESANLGHGLLTYALLKEGLEAGQADFKPKDRTTWLSEWLAYGVDRLPMLYAEKLGARGVLLTTVGHGRPALVQQPSLFDFTKQRRDMVLTTKSERRSD